MHKVYTQRYIIRYQHYETRDMTPPSPPPSQLRSISFVSIWL